jgi:GNAT superfamily N-acetyltransferase
MPHLIPHAAILHTQNFFFRSMAIACLEQEGLFATSMGINEKYLNSVISTNLSAEKLKVAIPGIIAFFAERNVPWIWQVSPFMKPSTLSSLLLSHGFTYGESFAVMGRACALPLPVMNLPGGEIRAISAHKDFDAWVLPLGEGFESTEEKTAQFRTLTERIPYGGAEAFHHYVLFTANGPVAAATLSITKYGARLDNIAVRTTEQRKGFGTAITLHLLHEAARFGAEYCFLDSSEEGAVLYKKLGFTEYYSVDAYNL